MSRGRAFALLLVLAAVAAAGATAQKFGWIRKARIALGFVRRGWCACRRATSPPGWRRRWATWRRSRSGPRASASSPAARRRRCCSPPAGWSPGDAEHASQTWAGILSTGYALDTRAVVYAREEDLQAALGVGGERGGVDLAALSVDRLAQAAGSLHDAAPRALLLLGRSQGQEALAGVGIDDPVAVAGKRLGVYPQAPAYFFALWILSRAGLSASDVRWVPLSSTLEAGRALREGRADAVVGFYGDVELAARDRGGKVLLTTADAPHLISTVLVARGEFAARYPDAVRRTLRGLLDAAAQVAKDPSPAARLLGEVAPYLGDPTEAIRSGAPGDAFRQRGLLRAVGRGAGDVRRAVPERLGDLPPAGEDLLGAAGRGHPGAGAAEVRGGGARALTGGGRGGERGEAAELPEGGVPDAGEPGGAGCGGRGHRPLRPARGGAGGAGRGERLPRDPLQRRRVPPRRARQLLGPGGRRRPGPGGDGERSSRPPRRSTTSRSGSSGTRSWPTTSGCPEGGCWPPPARSGWTRC